MTAISVENLEKTFQLRLPQKGFKGVIKNFVSPEYQAVEAVKHVSFSLEEGERVAFIGPNGAGKSTTIKMLTGILHPTDGHAEVLGKTPWKDRKTLSYDIGAVFGQRSQLWYHLPAGDTFDLLSKVYDMEEGFYKERRDFLVERFDVGGLLIKPVRQLSLGERMRCEIVASLLHKPKVLFLDEPTIGLDVTAKAAVRDLIKDSSEIEGTTILLTSHDTGDMEQVCDRVIVIDHGTLLLDEPISKLKKTYIKKRILTLATKEEEMTLKMPGVKELESEPHKSVFSVDVSKTPIEDVLKQGMKDYHFRDIVIEDPPMEEIIKEIYKRGTA